MRALLCRAFGPLERLSIEEVPSPRPGPGQVLVDVKACSLNFPDVLVVQGLYQVKPPLPFSPGSEAAGVVVEVGPGVTEVKEGDRVAVIGGFGGLAEEMAAETGRLVPLPEGMDFETGAAFLYAYGTALHALKDRGGLSAGETLLVMGAAGGVGLAAVEIGAAMGARVIAAASTPEKLALCRRQGAAETVNYTVEKLRDRVRELTGGKGADCVFDPVGGGFTEAALRATAWRGRLLVVGFAAGEIPRIPANLALLQERSVVGVYWGEWVRRDPAGHRQNVAQLLSWFAAGRIRPVVTERLPLAEAVAGLRKMAARQVTGKIVVIPEA